ncbi:MAG: alpha/beta fold hydrolase [bacterium]
MEINKNAQDIYLQGGRSGVLMTHGLAGSTNDLSELATALNKENATVLVKRLAGHGTNVHDLAKTTTDDWAKSLDEGLKKLEQTTDNIMLVGNSFGGDLLVDLAIRSQHKFTGLVLLATPIYIYGEWWKKIILPLALPFIFSVKKYWLKDKNKSEYQLSGGYLEVPLRAFKRFMEFLKISREQIKRINLPVMLVYSLHDSMIKPHSAEYIYEKVASQEKKLYWVHDTNHSPLKSEKKHGLFVEIINFYKRHNHQ